MHSYSTDENRLKIVKSIGVISFLLSLLLIGFLNYLIKTFASLVHYSGNVPSTPSIFIFGSLFIILYYAFDKLAWKISVKGIKISKTPDLSGQWTGHIKTNYNGGTEIDVDVSIKQTWTSMSITLETSGSKSESLAASILTSKSRLAYYYINEPNSSSVKTMNIHYGVTTLDIKDNNRLEGHYFTGRGRETYGDICLKKIE